MAKFTKYIVGAAVVGVGLIGTLVLINWGRENDIPVLMQAAEALDN